MKYTALLLHLLLFWPLAGQNWSWVTQLDGTDWENGRTLSTHPGGGWVIAGAYEGTLQLGSEQAASVGGTDVFVAAYDAEQVLQWLITAGGTADDQLEAMTVLPNGDLYCAGSFWYDLPIGDTVLTSGDDPKALFSALLSPEGEVKWAQAYQGIGLKDAGGTALLSNDQLAMSGYFEQDLRLGDTLLSPGTNDGTTYAFTAVFDQTGQLQWAVREGLRGDTRAVDLTPLPDGGFVTGGFFNDTTSIGGQIFTANTSDADIFLVAYDLLGSPLWAKKAGGVFDDDLTAMATDELGQIYATGAMVGVMDLGDGLNIQSQDGNADLFVLKYAADGTPLLARAFPNNGVQNSLGIALRGNTLAIGGLYFEELAIDEYVAPVDSELPTAFFLGMDTQLQAKWLTTVDAGADYSFGSNVAITPDQRVLAGGTIGESALFDDETLISNGSVSLFVGQLSPLLTATATPLPTPQPLICYPNPATDSLHFVATAIRCDLPLNILIYDYSGRLASQHQPSPCPTDRISIPIHHLAPGAYLWQMEQGGFLLGGDRFVKQ